MTSWTIPDDPHWITEEALFIIHAQQVERFGGAHGVRDKNVVLAALNRPINHWAYVTNADLADLAAVYLVGFAGTQGFNDGNKRTGLACALVFLELNGIPVNVEAKGLYELTMLIATSRVREDYAARWLRDSI